MERRRWLILILDEKKYVMGILEEPSMEPSKAAVFLSLYARYLYHEDGLKKTAILERLHAFMKGSYPHYRQANWAEAMEKYADRAGKYPLCQCGGIWVTESEAKTIEEIHDKVLERLAFTLLCLAKFQNFRNPSNHNWVSYSNGEIFSMACINTTAFEKDMKISRLKELGLIEYAKKISNLSIQVLWADESSPKKLFVSDFRKLGYEWRLYKGESFVRCESCQILTKKNSNRSKYCKSCAKASAAKSKRIWDIKMQELQQRPDGLARAASSGESEN